MFELVRNVIMQLEDNQMKPLNVLEDEIDDGSEYMEYSSIAEGIANFFKIKVCKGDIMPKDILKLYDIFVLNRFNTIVDAIHNYIISNMDSINRSFYDQDAIGDVNNIASVMSIDTKTATILHHMKDIVMKCMMDIPVEMDGHMGEALLKFTSRDIPIDICENISLFSVLVQDTYTDMKITTYISDKVTRKLLNKDSVAIVL